MAESVSRRQLIKAAAASAAIGASIGAAAPAVAQGSTSRTFVLVHGAWHGGWCWRRVADDLTARGHKVFTPTLTGVGERSHLLSSSINLETHITDVVNVLRWENLENVLLCGHSYGGWPISGVVEAEPSRISSIVYLDAFLPNNGQKVLDLNTPDRRQSVLDGIKNGELARKGPPAAAFEVNPSDRAWVDKMMTPQPIGVSVQPIHLTGARDRVAKKAYVRARKYPQPDFDRWYAQCAADPSWKVFDLPCGHDAMIDMPKEVSDILVKML